MERHVLLTGIGGQGVQLAAQVLARSALFEGPRRQLSGSYGGIYAAATPRPPSSSPTTGSSRRRR